MLFFIRLVKYKRPYGSCEIYINYWWVPSYFSLLEVVRLIVIPLALQHMLFVLHFVCSQEYLRKKILSAIYTYHSTNTPSIPASGGLKCMSYSKRRKFVFQATEQSIKMSKEEVYEYPLHIKVFCWRAFVHQTKIPPCSWIIWQFERLDIAQHELCITALVLTQGNELPDWSNSRADAKDK